MTIQKSLPLNANGVPLSAAEAQVLKNGLPSTLSDIDPSRLTITLASTLKTLPEPESLVFGEVTTDHMLYMDFSPERGWSQPQIMPYGPLNLDPASSCFQYCPNVFEGLKAYLALDGTPRLFRPQLNMDRMVISAERVALPPFNADALLTLIKRFVALEARWIPRVRGCSLYIRPTLIGTRASLGVTASTHAALYVVLSPTGPYIRNSEGKGISLLAMSDQVRAWPGGTGGYKLGLNYAPGFVAQRKAAALGYQQLLWLLGETVSEAGAMNVFAVFKRPDGELDVVTPPLDGTILPGVTRASVLSLLSYRPHITALPQLPTDVRINVSERVLTMSELFAASTADTLQEFFCVGTAAVVIPARRIGWQRSSADSSDVEDIRLPVVGGQGSLAQALWERLVDIQEGRVEWEGWGVTCTASD
ncbi:branched-chain amino acid aminotransferase II [Multifurca ochricompacta]|uniref:Branched-chain-amino-acid aminotransferase n=1 Tax=Multifurca ochricompacta TaxID=376703 RepID=A0AAD4M2Q8_9AGAM|nr:branched-chain amino acid aminotransferase II [Multifurca ochricompacta]